MTLRQELDAIREAPDAYLFHEHLEDINEAFYFHQFVDAAKRYGLEYLAEADIGDMLVTNFPPKIAETLRRVATDIIRTEQYMDFVRNRMFRQTLLVHQGTALQRNLDGNMLKGLQIASAARAESPQPVLTQGINEVFKTPSGGTLNIVDAPAKAALVLLRKQWPGCLPFEDLAGRVRASLRQSGAAVADDDDRSFGARMLQGYAVRAVELRVHRRASLSRCRLDRW
jgi:methyltransferase-like protein